MSIVKEAATLKRENREKGERSSAHGGMSWREGGLSFRGLPRFLLESSGPRTLFPFGTYQRRRLPIPLGVFFIFFLSLGLGYLCDGLVQ